MRQVPDTTRGVLSTIGHTPLIALNRLFGESSSTFYAKLESLNPGGSAKDRAAVSMVVDAIQAGRLVPGRSVVIESSSGNLGIGLAQVCNLYDLRFVCVTDPNATPQNLAILAAYGAEIDVVTAPAPDSGGYLAARIQRVRHLLAQTMHSFWPNQYANPRNAAAQEVIMQEVAQELGDRIDFVFVSTGSCGTLRGCRDYLRRHGSPTRLVAVDAVGSAIFDDQPAPRLIPGHGASVRPELWDDTLADEVIHVTDRDCVVGCRLLVGTESVLSGGSSGGVVVAARQRVEHIPDGSTCVLILPDRGDRYLDSVYSDDWVHGTFGDISHLWKSG